MAMFSLERHVTHGEHVEVINVGEQLLKMIDLVDHFPADDKQLLIGYIEGYLLVKGSGYWASYAKAPQYKIARFIPLIGTMVNSARMCEYAGYKILEEAEDLAAIRRKPGDYQIRNLANHLTTIVTNNGDDNKVSVDKMKEDDRILRSINFVKNWVQTNKGNIQSKL